MRRGLGAVLAGAAVLLGGVGTGAADEGEHAIVPIVAFGELQSRTARGRPPCGGRAHLQVALPSAGERVDRPHGG